MTAHEQLLADCAKLNVRLRPAEDGQLAIGGPRKALTTNLLERIKAHKADLLTALTAASETPGTRRTMASTDSDDRGLRWSRRGSSHRLCANAFWAIPITIPPPEIWASPLVLCPECHQRPVLRELRDMTGGQCYECATREEEDRD